ncbi:MAG: YceI family protein [Thermoleophilia bacterium]|nr:YceI family protein [Thermoleophilia bacterium]
MTSITETRTALPAGTWKADPVHSDIGFALDYMAGTFRGTFSRFTAELADGRLPGVAEVTSVQVKDANLEAHLQSPEFFDAERHPELVFESREITRSGDEVTMSGEITIRGHTEPVEIRGTVTDEVGDPYGNTRFGFRLTATVDRTAFGLNWNMPLPTGEPALANEVRIEADLQLVEAAA